MKFRERMQCAWMYLRSFFVSSYSLQDYPLRFTKLLQSEVWHAELINWIDMHGVGTTREAALTDLQRRFDDHRALNPLPRPGQYVTSK